MTQETTAAQCSWCGSPNNGDRCHTCGHLPGPDWHVLTPLGTALAVEIIARHGEQITARHRNGQTFMAHQSHIYQGSGQK